jgi:hypothetical protein
MKKTTVILFLFFSTIISYSQIHINGTVLANNKQDTLAFATFYNLKTKNGIASDKRGSYSISSEKLTDRIQISYIGYLDTIVTIEQLTSTPNIELKPQSFKVKQVDVYKKHYKTKELGYFKKKMGKSIASSRLSVFIPNKYASHDVVLKKVKFNIDTPFGAPLPTRIRLRGKDENNKYYDLLKDEIVISEYNVGTKQYLEYDISEQNIKIPEQGIQVLFEIINTGSSFSICTTPFFGISQNDEKLQIGLDVMVSKK